MAVIDAESRLADLVSRWEELQALGLSLTPEELCIHSPELAGKVREWIDALRDVGPLLGDASGSEIREPTVGSSRNEAHLPITARAEVSYGDLRFHAAGGLGEVFTGRDARLNREVALKFPKRDRGRNPESLRRFFREAEITGRLEHPGIVPIYALGTDSSGAPCYAMRFIRGATLQDAIHGFHGAERPHRDPSERSLALRGLLRRFISVCNTVAYAHSRNILHRDLKPSNVMLGDYDETLVVDWGLAKDLGSAGDDETTPGAVDGSDQPTAAVGTPGYMSPEQADGDAQAIGPASDVYSLGATLYAILTGQASLSARNPREWLERLRGGRFPRPRQVKPAVPRALEAVCLKAMALRPEDRYATARELSADVDRWLADEPVEAWREPILDRARRWLRRHRAVAVWGVAALVVVSVVSSTAALVVDRARRAERSAKSAAEANLQVARDAVDRFTMRVSQETLLNAPQMDRFRRDLLGAAREYYQRLVDQHPGAPVVQYDLARAHHHLAALTANLGEKPTAIQHAERARDLFVGLLAAHPEDTRIQDDLALCQHNLGWFAHEAGRTEVAERAYRASLVIKEKLVAAHPENAQYQSDLAFTINNLGLLLRSIRRSSEAEEMYRAVLAVRRKLAAAHPEVSRYQNNLVASTINLANLLSDTGRSDAAEAAYRDALEIQQKLVAAHPEVARYQSVLAACSINLANLQSDAGRSDAAEATYRAALEIQQKLVAAHPDVAQYQSDLGTIHFNLGNLYSGTGRSPEAHAAFQAALAIRSKLAAAHPDVPEYQEDLAASHRNLGTLYCQTGRRTDADAAFQAACSIQRQLAEAHPEVAQYRSGLARCHHSIGTLNHDRGRLPEAETAYRAALAIQQELAAAQSDVTAYRANLAQTHNDLGRLHREAGRRSEARTEFQAALAIQEELAAAHLAPIEYSAGLGMTYLNMGKLANDEGAPQAALAWFDRAIAGLDDVLRREPRHAESLRALREAQRGRSEAIARLGQKSVRKE